MPTFVEVSYGSIQKIAKKLVKLYPYKIHLVQRLHQEDLSSDLCSQQQCLASIENDPDYLSRIFFSDESNFHVSSRVHRHNVRIWGEENPHVIRPHERDSPKLKVWAGMLEHRLISSYF